MIVIRDHAHRPFSSESESGQFKICTTHELQENQRYRFKWRKQKKNKLFSLQRKWRNNNDHYYYCGNDLTENYFFFLLFVSNLFLKPNAYTKPNQSSFTREMHSMRLKLKKKFTMRKQKSFWFVQRNHLKWNTINVFFMSTLICVIASQQHKIDSLDSCWPLHMPHTPYICVYQYIMCASSSSNCIRSSSPYRVVWYHELTILYTIFLFIFLRRVCFGISNAFSLLRDFRNDWNAIDSN